MLHLSTRFGLAVVVFLSLSACSRPSSSSAQAGAPPANVSARCQTCHPAFYKKWATSHHGTAMQPFTAKFAKAELTGQDRPLLIGNNAYRAVLDASIGFVEERGPKGTRKLPIQHVLGGKNTYYFLTPMQRGRLQVLPLGYDIGKKSWYDMAASGVRMHIDRPADQALEWTDPAFTFNASCYSCHVSQLRTNYDLKSDTYHSTWREPGINCETCHGDGSAHVALYRQDLSAKHEDMRILRTTQFTVKQRNEMCAPCHAKMSPISAGYEVTQRFFDHYDLATLEDPDFYPDGRDLGENYTYTGWLMNPCIRNGKFDCIHCHTSSGRYRFATENPNGACQPCHQDKAANPQAHTHHKAGAPGGNCIDCHMPKTRFANMNRSDHSFLPPAPSATLKFQSPNACNLCHKDKGANWADAKVRQWHKRDYQKPVLERAALVDAARRNNWEKLPAMLSYITNPAGDHVTQASLLRLLQGCADLRKVPFILKALQSANPLVRAAAVSATGGLLTPEIRDALAAASGDEYRVVRIRAAAALAAVPPDALPVAHRESAGKATAELIASFEARPDDFASHTNAGNFHLDRGELDSSIRSFEIAMRLRPDSVPTMVNASIAYSRSGRMADAERVLDQALALAPANGPANFNRGLLLAETGKKAEAEAALRKALAGDANLSAAAFNLCVLMMERRDAGGLTFCRQAAGADPQNDKYAFSLSFYLDQAGQSAEALDRLQAFCLRAQSGLNTRLLLAGLFDKSGKKREALAAYRAASELSGITPDQQQMIAGRMRALQAR